MKYYLIQKKYDYGSFFNAEAMEWIKDISLATKFNLDNRSTAECLSLQVDGVMIEVYCP